MKLKRTQANTHTHTHTRTCEHIQKVYVYFYNKSMYRNINKFICTSYVDVVICTFRRNIRMRRKILLEMTYSQRHICTRLRQLAAKLKHCLRILCSENMGIWKIWRYFDVLFLWEVNNIAMQITDLVTRPSFLNNR
jgi:hypothetical protein